MTITTRHIRGLITTHEPASEGPKDPLIRYSVYGLGWREYIGHFGRQGPKMHDGLAKEGSCFTGEF